MKVKVRVKVKKVKSESDYFSRSNVWVYPQIACLQIIVLNPFLITQHGRPDDPTAIPLGSARDQTLPRRQTHRAHAHLRRRAQPPHHHRHPRAAPARRAHLRHRDAARAARGADARRLRRLGQDGGQRWRHHWQCPFATERLRRRWPLHLSRQSQPELQLSE